MNGCQAFVVYAPLSSVDYLLPTFTALNVNNNIQGGVASTSAGPHNLELTHLYQLRPDLSLGIAIQDPILKIFLSPKRRLTVRILYF